jgi:hypothetical protein
VNGHILPVIQKVAIAHTTIVEHLLIGGIGGKFELSILSIPKFLKRT